MSLIENENTQAKDAWNRNAEFWNERMGEGNDFLKVLLWPAVKYLDQFLASCSFTPPTTRRTS